MSEIIKGYLKYIIPGLIILALFGGMWWIYHHQYTRGYDAGIAAQKAAQEKANNDARLANEAEKTRLEREHAAQLADARADADAAANSVSRLQQQLTSIRRVALDNSRALGVSPSAGSTAGVLAQLFSESLERNRSLAEYADRARLAGQLCERQYDSLTTPRK